MRDPDARSRADRTRVRFGLAVASAFMSSGALYAILRIAQSRIWSEADPALVIWSEHAGYFWRSWIVSYVGGMIGFITWVFADRNAERVARWLARAVFVTVALLVVQATVVP